MKPASATRMLGRAMVLRCPRCGSKGIISGWFGMADCCPGCGHCFEARAEEGFFLGAFTINLAVTEGILLLSLFGYIFLLAATGGDVPVVPVLVACLTLAIVLPVLFYPFARCIWAAIDLALHSERDRRPAS